MNTIDDSKTHEKERMKAMSLIMQCYNNRSDLLNIQPDANELEEHTESVTREKKKLIEENKHCKPI